MASCALDEREVQLLLPNYGQDAGTDAAVLDTAARIEIAPTAIDLGWVTVGFPSRARVYISNAGSVPLPAPIIDWSANANGDFELIQKQCLAELAPGDRCELRVQVIPKLAGATSATLHVESAAGAADVSFSSTGLAGGDLILAPVAGTFEDFGGVLVGSMTQGVFSVTNPGATPTGPLALQSNRAEFAILPPTGDTADCVLGVTSLAPSQSCNVRVAFSPLERGPVEATLTANTEAAGAVSATLSGQGLLAGVLASSVSMIDFDGIVLGSAGRRAVTFQNAGDQPLTLVGTRLLPAEVEGFAIQTSDCAGGRALAGGESCSVQVEFRPPRSGEEMTAEIITEAVEGPQLVSVALRGIGLQLGALEVGATAAGEEDFGRVLLESSAVRSFTITNPGMQPSGVLTFTTSEGFEVQAPPLEGECVPGATSLVDGQSCTVRIGFTPTRREVQFGSLTVNSELAGANSLPLTGQGIIAAAFELESDLDFGRVFTNAPASRTFLVKNAGDELLSPPQLEISSTSQEMASAFTHESACALPLAFGEACEITVRFAPTQALPHSANLTLTSGELSTTVLLLAEALAPGSLVLAAQGSADFGDVPVQTTVTRNFTLTNPGNAPSGLLTIRSDSNRFVVALGDCNAGEPEGLADGSSCTFSVAFTPGGSEQLVANLSVQSPGAGQAGIELRGRGRALPTLTATGNRNLGRANIGQDALTQPENQFTWTVSNEGDLASGVLRVTNSNPTEFERTNDSCNNAQITGRSSCQMTLRFRPAETGTRSANVVVTDMTNMRSTTLALTGTGVRLAQLGQSCVNATCAAGMCTGGVCCDRDCDGGCQVCSTAGVCTDQSSREACGSGSGRCFGVDRCLLPEGLPCGQNGDCGLSNCERRLGGTGANDRICCAEDCEATGRQCNAQGQCQQPTLGDGALCGRPGDLACGGNLQCKRCLDGASRCTAPNVCCGGCTAPYVCIDGQRCGCDIGTNGVRMRDCGGGECVLERTGACCVGQGQCPAATPVCDGNADLCRQCIAATDCPAGGTGTRRACNSFTCSLACNTQQGFKDCGNLRCIDQLGCCGDADCGPCARCNAMTDTCVPLTAGQADRCPGANEVCNSQQSCVEQRNPGQTCSAGQICTQSSCIDGRCCPSTCPNGCRADATCNCPAGATFDDGACVCNGALESCDGGCFDLAVARSHCGACDSACLGGQCLGGVCRSVELSAGSSHTCIMLPNLGVRCWGSAFSGALGYGNTTDIGDNETPASAGLVSTGGTVIQLAAGGSHTCALLSTGDVRCWGSGFNGTLGYGNTTNIGDTELPSTVGTVSIGGAAVQVVAGSGHTCALLATGAVRCWGGGNTGALGYGNTNNIGDNELPSSVPAVNVGGTVQQLAAGGSHTCALLDTGAVRCWGINTFGQLGYGHTNTIGDNEAPALSGNVNVGGTVAHITAGLNHTCALLTTGAVRCWGRAFAGELGYGNTNGIGDTEAPATAGDVNVGGTVRTIDAGGSVTCALLTSGAVRCWGAGGNGQLGYGNTETIGDTETPAAAGNVGVGANVAQISVGDAHTCAVLETSGAVRCWGFAGIGTLGYGNGNTIGDNELPSTAGNLVMR